MDIVFVAYNRRSKACYYPYLDLLFVNGRYTAKTVEAKIERIFTHECIHSILFSLEGFSTSRAFDRSQAVDLI
jgi:hypothetical protein